MKKTKVNFIALLSLSLFFPSITLASIGTNQLDLEQTWGVKHCGNGKGQGKKQCHGDRYTRGTITIKPTSAASAAGVSVTNIRLPTTHQCLYASSYQNTGIKFKVKRPRVWDVFSYSTCAEWPRTSTNGVITCSSANGNKAYQVMAAYQADKRGKKNFWHQGMRVKVIDENGSNVFNTRLHGQKATIKVDENCEVVR